MFGGHQIKCQLWANSLMSYIVGRLPENYIDIIVNESCFSAPLICGTSRPGDRNGISKFDKNFECSCLKYSQPITTQFCTRHDSVTVVTCAKFRCDR